MTIHASPLAPPSHHRCKRPSLESKAECSKHATGQELGAVAACEVGSGREALGAGGGGGLRSAGGRGGCGRSAGGAGRGAAAAAAAAAGGADGTSVLGAAGDGQAGLLGGQVHFVVLDAVGLPLRADEEGEGLLVGGDVGVGAVGAGADVGQVVLDRVLAG